MLNPPRLRLIPFEPRLLLALIVGDSPVEWPASLRPAAGLQEFFHSDQVSPVWLAQLRASTETDPWRHGFAVIHTGSETIIGSVGFHAPPADGLVEIAYGIVPAFQGQGYATEAAMAGIHFAFASGLVNRVRAHTLPTANASTRVLAKCGFTCLGEVIEPEDGPVWRWERAADHA